MRTAPPVSVRCSGGAAWPALRAGLPALAAGAVAAWAFGHAGWRVTIDAGAFLLSRLQPEGRREASRWIAVTAREAGPAMHALRTAAYARVAGVDPAADTGPDGLRLPR